MKWEVLSMDQNLYPMIFKRKSFHIFKEILKISEEEKEEIEKIIETLVPLVEDIQVKIRLVENHYSTCKRGQEYCILFYSEKKDHYLQNIGYLGQQLDLALVAMDIGTLWFGMGKVEEKEYEGLSYVIQIAIAKMPSDKFRKDMYKSKRKALEHVWEGEYSEIGNIARFAPSACNLQPWYTKATNDHLTIYRYKLFGKRGMMPLALVSYYNQIDVGIYLCFIELLLQENHIDFKRELKIDIDEGEYIEYAHYTLTKCAS